MNKKKISKTQVVRHGIQLIAFLIFPGLFITTFAAVGDIYKAILNKSFELSAYGNQLLLLLAIFPITILFGRFFCGYLCSFGAFGDLLWAVSNRIMKKPVVVSARIDKILKYLKYVILLLIIIAVWTVALPVDYTYNPWNIFGMYSSLKGWGTLAGLFSVGGILLLLIMIGNFFVERFFCRYICPLGAVFTILSYFRLYRIKKPGDKCGACQLCTRKCSMGIPLKAMDVVHSGECIDCYRCVDVCPRDNVSTIPASSPMVVGAVAAVAITGLYYAGTIAAPKLSSHKEYDTVSSEPVVGQNAYVDGVYTGEGSGFRGKTTVEIKVENGIITDITIVSTDDDRDFFDKASNSIIAEIIGKQSVDVDAVSGATFSSNGIIEAVENALNIGSTDNNVKDSSDDKEKFEDNNQSDNQMDDNSSGKNSNQVGELDFANMADGEYTGIGMGFRGEVKVTVKIEDKAVTGITIDSYQDDQEFFESAQNTIIEEIIDGQSLNVDAVSGATFSSNGIIEAVANALNVSFSNPNSENQKNGHGHGYGKNRNIYRHRKH